jgi:hypothetical protein
MPFSFYECCYEGAVVAVCCCCDHDGLVACIDALIAWYCSTAGTFTACSIRTISGVLIQYKYWRSVLSYNLQLMTRPVYVGYAL